MSDSSDDEVLGLAPDSDPDDVRLVLNDLTTRIANYEGTTVSHEFNGLRHDIQLLNDPNRIYTPEEVQLVNAMNTEYWVLNGRNEHVLTEEGNQGLNADAEPFPEEGNQGLNADAEPFPEEGNQGLNAAAEPLPETGTDDEMETAYKTHFNTTLRILYDIPSDEELTALKERYFKTKREVGLVGARVRNSKLNLIKKFYRNDLAFRNKYADYTPQRFIREMMGKNIEKQGYVDALRDTADPHSRQFDALIEILRRFRQAFDEYLASDRLNEDTVRAILLERHSARYIEVLETELFNTLNATFATGVRVPNLLLPTFRYERITDEQLDRVIEVTKEFIDSYLANNEYYDKQGEYDFVIGLLRLEVLEAEAERNQRHPPDPVAVAEEVEIEPPVAQVLEIPPSPARQPLEEGEIPLEDTFETSLRLLYPLPTDDQLDVIRERYATITTQISDAVKKQGVHKVNLLYKYHFRKPQYESRYVDSSQSQLTQELLARFIRRKALEYTIEEMVNPCSKPFQAYFEYLKQFKHEFNAYLASATHTQEMRRAIEAMIEERNRHVFLHLRLSNEEPVFNTLSGNFRDPVQFTEAELRRLGDYRHLSNEQLVRVLEVTKDLIENYKVNPQYKKAHKDEALEASLQYVIDRLNEELVRIEALVAERYQLQEQAKDEPMDEEPAIDDEEPAIDDEEPGIDDEEPAIDDEEPAIDDEEPVIDELSVQGYGAEDESQPPVPGYEFPAQGYGAEDESQPPEPGYEFPAQGYGAEDESQPPVPGDTHQLYEDEIQPYDLHGYNFGEQDPIPPLPADMYEWEPQGMDNFPDDDILMSAEPSYGYPIPMEEDEDEPGYTQPLSPAAPPVRSLTEPIRVPIIPTTPLAQRAAQIDSLRQRMQPFLDRGWTIPLPQPLDYLLTRGCTATEYTRCVLMIDRTLHQAQPFMDLIDRCFQVRARRLRLSPSTVYRINIEDVITRLDQIGRNRQYTEINAFHYRQVETMVAVAERECELKEELHNQRTGRKQ